MVGKVRIVTAVKAYNTYTYTLLIARNLYQSVCNTDATRVLFAYKCLTNKINQSLIDLEIVFKRKVT